MFLLKWQTQSTFLNEAFPALYTCHFPGVCHMPQECITSSRVCHMTQEFIVWSKNVSQGGHSHDEQRDEKLRQVSMDSDSCLSLLPRCSVIVVSGFALNSACFDTWQNREMACCLKEMITCHVKQCIFDKSNQLCSASITAYWKPTTKRAHISLWRSEAFLICLGLGADASGLQRSREDFSGMTWHLTLTEKWHRFSCLSVSSYMKCIHLLLYPLHAHLTVPVPFQNCSLIPPNSSSKGAHTPLRAQSSVLRISCWYSWV